MKNIYLFTVLFFAIVTYSRAQGLPEGEYNALFYIHISAHVENFSNNCGGNYVNITAHRPFLSPWQWNNYIYSGNINFSQSTTMPIGFDAVTVETKRQYTGATVYNCTTATDCDSYTFHFNAGAIFNSQKWSIPCWKGSTYDTSYFQFIMCPKKFDIQISKPAYDNAVNTYSFSVEDKITLTATPGFPAYAYQWQYSFTPNDSNSWVDFPSPLPKHQTVQVCGNDLFGNNALSMVTQHKKISFRIKPLQASLQGITIKTDIPDSYPTLDMVPSAPHIIGTNVVDALCHNGNGKVTLFFDRELLQGERLVLYKSTFANNNEKIDSISYFNNATKSIIINDIASKSEPYTFSLLGYYNTDDGYQHTTYTDGPDHRATATISSPPPLSFSYEKKHITCYNGFDGRIKVTANGGVGNYKLHYNKSGENEKTKPFTGNNITVDSLKAGFYELRIRDGNGCFIKEPDGSEHVESIVLTQPSSGPQISVYDVDTQQPSAYGMSNGSVTFDVNGDNGSGYLENTVSHIQHNPSDLDEMQGGNIHRFLFKDMIPSGDYVFYYTTDSGCRQSIPFSLPQPEPLTASASVTQGIDCHGEHTGSLSASAEGGVIGQGYNYQWAKYENGDYVDVFAYGAQLDNIGAGDYRVTVTDNTWTDQKNTAIAYVSISEPAQVQLGDVNITHAACYGDNSGALRIAAQGGTGSYVARYKKAGEYAESAVSFSAASPATVSGLSEGDCYIVKLTDSKGCEADIQYGGIEYTIEQPEMPVSVNPFGHKNASGFGRSDGMMAYQAEGGTPNGSGAAYTVTWKNGSGQTIAPTNTITDGVFTTQIDNLPAGQYTLTVKDRNGCTVTVSGSIQEPAPLTVSLTQTATVNCHGEKTGELLAHASGGVAFDNTDRLPYTFTWYSAGGSASGADSLLSGHETDRLSAMPGGHYKVHVEDGSTPANTAVSNIFFISEPSLPIGELTTGNISCFDGSDGFIRLRISGGTGSYRLFYRSENQNDGYREHTVNSDGHTFLLENLTAGAYSVYATDANNCYVKINGDDTHVITLSQPQAPVSINPFKRKNTSGIGRSDGTLAFHVEGGTPDYTVTWQNAEGQTLTPENTVIEGLHATQISNLPKGFYTLTVKDQNNCTASVSDSIRDPAPLTVSLIQTATVDCHGEHAGELHAQINGGVPFDNPNGLAYTLKWYSVGSAGDSLLAGQISDRLSSMPSGSYRVHVEDSSTPPNTAESDTFLIGEPSLLVTEQTVGDISCFDKNDGFIRIGVTGGVGGYRLFYRNENQNGDYREHPVNADGNTFLLENMFAGAYSVYITDANNCHAKIMGDDTHTIMLQQPDAPLRISSVRQNSLSGYGLSNGDIAITVEGGTAKTDAERIYDAVWTNGQSDILADSAVFENGKFVSYLKNLPQGAYTVRITDGKYAQAPADRNSTCFITASCLITEPEPLAARIEKTHYISCNGMSDGQLTATATGGVSNPETIGLPYKYRWYRVENGERQILSGQADSILRNAPAGDYEAEIEDYSRIFNKIIVKYRLEEPEVLQAGATEAHISCGQATDVSATVTGGTLPYRYEWSTGDTTAVIADAVAGKYMAYITDARGCRTTAVARITTPSSLTANGITHNPVCYRAGDGSIELTVSGGTAPYSFLWNTGAVAQNLTGASAGKYGVTVTDNGGCSFHADFTLEEPAPVAVNIGEDRVLCKGQSVELMPEVQEPDSRYEWATPDGFRSTEPRISADKSGIYKLTVTDGKGCQASDELRITVRNFEISSEIVVASDVFVDDTVVIVNISAPQSQPSEWLVGESDSLTVVEMTERMLKVVFHSPGKYQAGLRTFVDDCYADNIKSIMAHVADSRRTDAYSESIIRKFVLYPNPNSGVFTIDVELSKASPIRLRIVDVASGGTVSDIRLQGRQEYSLPYSLLTTASAYVVLLETSGGYMVLKMIAE